MFLETCAQKKKNVRQKTFISYLLTFRGSTVPVIPAGCWLEGPALWEGSTVGCFLFCRVAGKKTKKFHEALEICPTSSLTNSSKCSPTCFSCCSSFPLEDDLPRRGSEPSTGEASCKAFLFCPLP